VDINFCSQISILQHTENTQMATKASALPLQFRPAPLA